MSIHLDQRRSRAVAAFGAAIAATSLLAAAVPAGADPGPGEPGYSQHPYYFAPDELAQLSVPWGVSRDPRLPSGVADLASGDPSCPAPAPLAATDDGSPEGYTLPVRIKVTNGTMVAGYSPSADHWGQGVPYSTTLRGLTGWVNARVQLPSMKLLVDRDDVDFCDGAGVSIADISGITPPDWGTWDDEGSYVNSRKTRADGSEFYAYPGTFLGSYLYAPDMEPARRLNVEDLAVKSISAKLSGIRADGSLDLSVDLALGATLAIGNGNPDLQFPIDIKGTFSTAVKMPITPQVSGISWDIGEPPSKRSPMMPTKPLAGAVEGGRTSVGSNAFTFDTGRLDAMPPGDGRSLAVSLLTFLYGSDKYGADVLLDQPWGDYYNAFINGMLDGSASFPAIAEGVSEVGVDMTVDKVGLPKGVPAGYGFDG
ncbi:hypothetical protein [Nocardioides sp. LML1-1-1.1]|uniref:hypothetical protein n=1 Tax=Nocardioides sp. LML1-1-1.1 TaxID=3135248 RepID=UPI00342DE2C7